MSPALAISKMKAANLEPAIFRTVEGATCHSIQPLADGSTRKRHNEIAVLSVCDEAMRIG